MSEKYKPGDVVELMSGGPKMTIINYTGETSNTWRVCWFNAALEISNAEVSEELICPVGWIRAG